MTTTHLNTERNWLPVDKKPVLVCGPCSAESEEQMLSTSKSIAQYFPDSIFRAGIWKPRTRPNSFEGVGTIGLNWLKQVKKTTGLLVSTEVANTQHVEECLKAGIDMLWIGARTTVNPFYVQEIADSLKGIDIPVFVKNPIHPDLQLWIGALERLNSAGITKLAAVHRGFHTYDTRPFRNAPQWDLVIELKATFPNLPILCDASHICGNTEMIPYIAQKAMDLDLDGLMLETHINPSAALSDAKQQLTPFQLFELIQALQIRESFSENEEFKSQLIRLREKINLADDEMLQLLAQRMNMVGQIAAYKRDNKVTILQVNRWKEILRNQMHNGETLGLSKEFVKQLYLLMHDESIRIQAEIMNVEAEIGKSKSELLK
jgi:chorismate mutase